MRKLLLTGTINPVLNNLETSLKKYFDVQISSENSTVFRTALKTFRPEFVVISLFDFTAEQSILFELLCTEFSTIPVLIIGTTHEVNIFKHYFQSRKVTIIERPTTPQAILDWCCYVIENTLDIRISPAEKRHILIVDDSPLVLRNIKELLEDKYSVSVATSGTQALLSIGKRRPHLILLDYSMPEMDGRQALELIRADADLKTIPVIFLTSMADKEIVSEILKLKPEGYLLKPPSSEQLLSQIESVLKTI